MVFELLVFGVCGILIGQAVLGAVQRRSDQRRWPWGALALRRRSQGELMKLAMAASLSVAAVLIVAKLVAWNMTGSVSLFASLLDTTLDSLTSVVNFFAVRHSLKPADRRYRFGHGKVEPLAGLLRSLFVAGTAFLLVTEAYDRISNPIAVEHVAIGIGVMLFAMFSMVGLVTFQRFVVRQTGSTAVASDALHYESHAMVNAAVIFSLGLSSGLGWTLADPIFALAITVYILRNAWRIGRLAFRQIMDREISEQEMRRIEETILRAPGVKGVRDLRTRQSGLVRCVQFRLVLDPKLRLSEAETIKKAATARVRGIYRAAEVLIQLVPAGPAAKSTARGGVSRKRKGI